MAQQGKNSTRNGRGRGMTIAVGALAVIMVLTMMLPSLSLIFSGSSAAEEASDPTTVAEADERYGAEAQALEAALGDEPSALQLANVGYTYFEWATSVRSLAGTIAIDTAEDAEVAAESSAEDDTAHAEELFGTAAGYFDRSLALEDTPSVHVCRLLCTFYLGQEEQATEEMAAYAEESDYGPAWANLGMFYATAANFDAAKDAFNKAIEVDADDAYGAKSYAEQYLAYIEQIEQLTASLTEDSSDGAADAETTEDTPSTSSLKDEVGGLF